MTTTSTETGEIAIHSENIFPIIKKWLYSEKDIFLRELISNAFDAINKLKTISLTENLTNLNSKGRIDISINKSEKTLVISDNGLGMTREETKTYIKQIAFSGAEDFLAKYKDNNKDAQIIGHFGLGFYSSFMVSNIVEINTLSYKENAEPLKWVCDGSTKFEIFDGKREAIGTDIILHINEDNQEYLEEIRIKELIKKYADFFPVEIYLNNQLINNHDPIWLKTPQVLKDDDYLKFYDTLFPFNEKPLFWIHLNVDYPFRLEGVLFFPKITNEVDLNKGLIKLYCQQVYVTDEVKVVIPEFLTMLRGVIDCPDIPLNVSRSFLQNEPYVQKISNFIVKKVADKLSDLFNKDKAQYEKLWHDLQVFVKFGMMNNQSFFEKMQDFIIFKSSNGYFTTLKEYLERNKEKLNQTIYYTFEDKNPLLNLLKEQDLEYLYLSSALDVHFLQFLEMRNQNVKFLAVDSELSEHLIDTNTEAKIIDPKDNKTQKQKLLDIFQNNLTDKNVKIKVENLKSANIPVTLLEGEQSKRFKNLSLMMKTDFPAMNDYTLVVNEKNEVVKNILKHSLNLEKTNLIVNYLYDLAKISQNKLNAEGMNDFLDRSEKILHQFTNL